MALERKTSVGVGLGAIAVVWGIYNQSLPTVADARVAQPANTDLAAAEKSARWTAGAVVTGLALITWDATVFIFGAGALIAFSWMHRHANQVNPAQGAAYLPSSRAQSPDGSAVVDNGYLPG